MYGFEALTFNIHGGYLEAIVRGHRSGVLTAADYNNLCQCESLDDIKMHLSATEYGPYLQNGAFLFVFFYECHFHLNKLGKLIELKTGVSISWLLLLLLLGYYNLWFFMTWLQNLPHCTPLQLWRNARLNWWMITSICYVKPRSHYQPSWSIARMWTLFYPIIPYLISNVGNYWVFTFIT